MMESALIVNENDITEHAGGIGTLFFFYKLI